MSAIRAGAAGPGQEEGGARCRHTGGGALHCLQLIFWQGLQVSGAALRWEVVGLPPCMLLRTDGSAACCCGGRGLLVR